MSTLATLARTTQAMRAWGVDDVASRATPAERAALTARRARDYARHAVALHHAGRTDEARHWLQCAEAWNARAQQIASAGAR